MLFFLKILLYFDKLSFSFLEKKVVAFNVRLKNSVNGLATNGRVVFANVDLNEWKGYDSSTGIFTSPAAGMYAFDWTILAMPGKFAYTALVVNGKFKSWNYCDGSASKTNISCSKMTVVKLKQEDKVWIGVFAGSAFISQKYTSFSGYNM